MLKCQLHNANSCFPIILPAPFTSSSAALTLPFWRVLVTALRPPLRRLPASSHSTQAPSPATIIATKLLSPLYGNYKPQCLSPSPVTTKAYSAKAPSQATPIRSAYASTFSFHPFLPASLELELGLDLIRSTMIHKLWIFWESEEGGMNID